MIKYFRLRKEIKKKQYLITFFVHRPDGHRLHSHSFICNAKYAQFEKIRHELSRCLYKFTVDICLLKIFSNRLCKWPKAGLLTIS